jgi:rhodanese-related sulfurtransferase
MLSTDKVLTTTTDRGMSNEEIFGRTGNMLLFTLLLGATQARAGAPPVMMEGSVRACANKSKTMAIDQAGKPTMIVRFNDKTSFLNVPSVKDILPGENVAVEYQHDGDDNLATRITRVIPKLPAGVGNMTVKEIEGLIATGNKGRDYLLVDARPAAKYASGHIPTAISIPLPALEKEGAKLLPSQKGIQIVFYCGGVSCGLSHKSAQIARSLGYSNVKVYTGGEPDWKKTEHYTVPSASFLKDGNVVLVDLREPGAAAGGHIPGAVNIPLARASSRPADLFGCRMSKDFSMRRNGHSS